MIKIKTLLDELYSLTHGTMTHDTKRMEEISSFLDNPHNNYPTIHVAGTNGKGSVCSIIASILQENGYKVGLYTSPHILRFNERIKINGKCILDEKIINNYELIRELSSKIGASFFEITTAIAFKYFSDNNVDIAIIETGLGGKLDSTNIITPILSIITSISQDHTKILGKNINKIATEKAGIIKTNVPVIIQDTNPKIINILLKQANKMSATAYTNYDFPPIEFEKYNDNNEMIYNVSNFAALYDFLADKEYFFNIDNLNISQTQRTTKLIGKHQINNIKTASFASLFITNNFKIKKGTISKGIENVIANTGLRFRIENISSTNNPIILDVAHNIASINALVEVLKELKPNQEWNFIFSAMKDKNIKQMLKSILTICKKLTIVKPNIERAASQNFIKKKALEIGFNNIEVSDIPSACKNAISSNEPYVICGTFFIMEEVATALQINNVL